MIAILSTTYSELLETSSFKYKCQLFDYCERFLIAQQDKNFGELVVHAPPLNILSSMLIPFTLVSGSTSNKEGKNIMFKISKSFQVLMYWVENMLFIAAFAIAESVLYPLVYLKTLFNIIMSCRLIGIRCLLVNLVKFIAYGHLQILMILFQDIWALFSILSMHNGCKEATDDNKDDDKEEELKIKSTLRKKLFCYNEIRQVVIKMYIDIKEEEDKNNESDCSYHECSEHKVEPDYETLNILQMIEEDEEKEYDPKLFTVKLTIILQNWKKFKYQEYKRELEEEKIKRRAKKGTKKDSSDEDIELAKPAEGEEDANIELP